MNAVQGRNASHALTGFMLVTLAFVVAPAPAARAAETQAYILTSDYSTGGLSVMDLSTRGITKDVSSVFADAAIGSYGGLLYVVNRFGQDNIQVIDPAAGFATVRQFSTGVGSNPQDIAFASISKAYVSLYEKSALLVCNPVTGAPLDTISLAAFADADHLPEMAHLAMDGTHLLVAIQRLDRLNGYVASGPGLVAVVDTQADTVLDVDPATPGVQAITLSAANPVTDFVAVPGAHELLIGCAGNFGVEDGGIEGIDTSALQSVGLISTEAQLGGDIGDLEWYSGSHGYAIVSDASYNASVVSFDPGSGAKLGTVYSPGGFNLPDMALDDRGELFVADNGFTTAGVYLFRAGADALIAGPLDTGLPPLGFAFGSGGPAPGGTPVITLDPPVPNPTSVSVALAIHLATASRVEVAVFDLTGRRVATLASGDQAAGDLALNWSLNERDGRRVPAGIYLIRAEAGGKQSSRRVAVLN